MNRFANSHLGIGALVVLALFFVYRNIVSPLINNGAENVAVIDDAIVDDWMDNDGSDDPQQALQIATAQYDVGHFSSTDLHWNEHPARDPFKPLSAIEVRDVASVANKVQSASVVTVGRVLKLPVVSAVVKGETINFAVIDDRIVTVGDEVADFRVEQLARASVTLRELATGEMHRVLVRE